MNRWQKIGLISVILLFGGVVSFFLIAANTKDLEVLTATSKAMPMQKKPVVPVATDAPFFDVAAPVELKAPKDVSQEDWNKIVASLASDPNKDKELQRIGEFLGFSHRIDMWRESKNAGVPSAQRSTLTQELLNEVPLHVSRNEMVVFEAITVVSSLLQDTITDPAMLKEAILQKTEQIKARVPKLDNVREQAQNAALASYKEKEVAILSEWEKLPVSQQDNSVLVKRLDDARAAAFDGPSK